MLTTVLSGIQDRIETRLNQRGLATTQKLWTPTEIIETMSDGISILCRDLDLVYTTYLSLPVLAGVTEHALPLNTDGRHIFRNIVELTSTGYEFTVLPFKKLLAYRGRLYTSSTFSAATVVSTYLQHVAVSPSGQKLLFYPAIPADTTIDIGGFIYVYDAYSNTAAYMTSATFSVDPSMAIINFVMSELLSKDSNLSGLADRYEAKYEREKAALKIAIARKNTPAAGYMYPTSGAISDDYGVE